MLGVAPPPLAAQDLGHRQRAERRRVDQDEAQLGTLERREKETVEVEQGVYEREGDGVKGVRLRAPDPYPHRRGGGDHENRPGDRRRQQQEPGDGPRRPRKGCRGRPGDPPLHGVEAREDGEDGEEEAVSRPPGARGGGA